MIIVLLGPPGSGKGTQAELISKNFGFYRISIGDMLRDLIKKEDEIGREAKRYLLKGDLVPDNLVLEMVEQEIVNEKRRGGIILDGFPRNINQASSFDEFLVSKGKKIDIVFYFDIPRALLMRRLSQRLLCPVCGAVYNLETDPPKHPNICDRCGATLIKRDDDREAIVKSRFSVYEKETAPVKEFYRGKGLLFNIDSRGSKDKIWKEVKKRIDKNFNLRSSNKKGGDEK